MKSPHCVPGESDGRRLPGDAKAGAVGGSEAGGAVTAAGRDGHRSRGLRAEVKGQYSSICYPNGRMYFVHFLGLLQGFCFLKDISCVFNCCLGCLGFKL